MKSTTMRRFGLVLVASVLSASTVNAGKTLGPSFALSPEKWRTQCPAIETYEALSARGIQLERVLMHNAYARYSTKKESGPVVFDTRIDTFGAVRDVQLVSAELPTLVAPALHAISRWRFEPLVVDDTPTCVEIRLQVDVHPYTPTPPVIRLCNPCSGGKLEIPPSPYTLPPR